MGQGQSRRAGFISTAAAAPTVSLLPWHPQPVGAGPVRHGRGFGSLGEVEEVLERPGHVAEVRSGAEQVAVGAEHVGQRGGASAGRTSTSTPSMSGSRSRPRGTASSSSLGRRRRGVVHERAGSLLTSAPPVRRPCAWSRGPCRGRRRSRRLLASRYQRTQLSGSASTSARTVCEQRVGEHHVQTRRTPIRGRSVASSSIPRRGAVQARTLMRRAASSPSPSMSAGRGSAGRGQWGWAPPEVMKAMAMRPSRDGDRRRAPRT